MEEADWLRVKIGVGVIGLAGEEDEELFSNDAVFLTC
jgi:hypothetical protein